MTQLFAKNTFFAQKKRIHLRYEDNTIPKEKHFIKIECILSGQNITRITGKDGFCNFHSAMDNVMVYVDNKKYGYMFLQENTYIYI